MLYSDPESAKETAAKQNLVTSPFDRAYPLHKIQFVSEKSS